MQVLPLLFISILVICQVIPSECSSHKEKYDDNDFAEFEEFDDEIPLQKNKVNKPTTRHKVDIVEDDDEGHVEIENEFAEEDIEAEKEREEREQFRQERVNQDDEAVVEEEDDSDEFSHFADEEEFIGYDGERPQGTGSKTPRTQEEPKITIAKVPLHLRSNWDSFYLEMLMMAGLLVYFVNFILGKGKNQKLANAWFDMHKSLFESNFALVGDDGKPEIETSGLRKESENCYILWCSGRTLMEGMLVELRLIKRQDLIGVISQMIRPSLDQLIIRVNLEEMDGFVFAFGTKKTAGKLVKEMTDISTYCPEKRPGDKFGIGSQFCVHSELSEVSSLILRDHKVLAVINKYPELVDYFHFSDQYSGPKQQEETQPTKLPPVKKILVFAFNFPKESVSMDSLDTMKPLMQLVIYLSDKISRLRLTKEAKMKSEKNRAKVEEAFLKATHAARAEIAQTLREEKKRKERERIMSLDDPDKQRKWEEREQKRQMKRRAPKMKTLKIKPM